MTSVMEARLATLLKHKHSPSLLRLLLLRMHEEFLRAIRKLNWMHIALIACHHGSGPWPCMPHGVGMGRLLGACHSSCGIACSNPVADNSVYLLPAAEPWSSCL